MEKIYKIIFLCFLFLIAPSLASAATLSISPSSDTSSVGDFVTVRIVVSSANESINAISADLLFPPSIFSIQSVSKNGSILNFWVTEPSFKKSSGVVHLEGVALNGFKGSSGTVLTITLKAINAGSGKALFQTGQVLANDGQGTDVTGSFSGGNFIVKEVVKKTPEPKVVEEPEPEPVEEYKPLPKGPEIVFGEKYGTPAITGTSGYPKTQVVLTFVAQNGVKVFISGTSDADGGFTLVVPSSLRSGLYTAYAVMVKNDKTNSENSNIISLKIGNALSDTRDWMIVLMILLMIIIIYLSLRNTHHSSKNKDIYKQIKHKTGEAEKIIHKSFEILRDDIHEYEHEKLTIAEHKIIAEIKKDINDAEKFITKEVKDIESI